MYSLRNRLYDITGVRQLKWGIGFRTGCSPYEIEPCVDRQCIRPTGAVGFQPLRQLIDLRSGKPLNRLFNFGDGTHGSNRTIVNPECSTPNGC